MDNGAPFRSQALDTWAARRGTHLLYSPPRCPRYNGAIEASIGALATRAHHAAAAAGHPEFWTCDDVEHARLAANAHVQRRASRVTRAERRRFAHHYQRRVGRTSGDIRPARRRAALVHTLVELGYMSMERKANSSSNY